MKLAALLFALTLLSSPASAGVADSPLSELVTGEKTLHLYTIPGVIGAFGNIQTLFSCTSMERAATIQVGVEVFSGAAFFPDNDAVASSLALLPGQTVQFATGAAAAFTPDSNLGVILRTGSARILATSKRLTCTAFIVDELSQPPASMVHLTIIAKTKQKASN